MIARLIGIALACIIAWPAYAQIVLPGGGSGSGGGSGTVTSVTVTTSGGGANTGTCNSTTSINCNITTQDVPNDLTGANVNLSGTPCAGSSACYGQSVFLDNASTQTPTIIGAASATAGTYVDVCNVNTGVQTLTPSAGTIGGASTWVYGAGTNAAPVGCNRLESDGVSNWRVKPYNGASAGSSGVAFGLLPAASTFYAPFNTFAGAGNTHSSGYTFFVPIYIGQASTWDAVELIISAGYSGTGNGFAVGIYASGTGQGTHTALNRPDGAPLAHSTFSTSTGTGNTLMTFSANAAITTPGMYWLAYEYGDATQTTNAPNSTAFTNLVPFLIGNASFGAQPYGVSVAGTGGTFPTLTSSTTFTEVTTPGDGIYMEGRVHSVP